MSQFSRGRQADKNDLLSVLSMLGVHYAEGANPTVTDIRVALIESFEQLHSSLAILYPDVPRGVGLLRNQQRLRALHEAAKRKASAIAAEEGRS